MKNDTLYMPAIIHGVQAIFGWGWNLRTFFFFLLFNRSRANTELPANIRKFLATRLKVIQKHYRWKETTQYWILTGQKYILLKFPKKDYHIWRHVNRQSASDEKVCNDNECPTQISQHRHYLSSYNWTSAEKIYKKGGI